MGLLGNLKCHMWPAFYFCWPALVCRMPFIWSPHFLYRTQSSFYRKSLAFVPFPKKAHLGSSHKWRFSRIAHEMWETLTRGKKAPIRARRTALERSETMAMGPWWISKAPGSDRHDRLYRVQHGTPSRPWEASRDAQAHCPRGLFVQMRTVLARH